MPKEPSANLISFHIHLHGGAESPATPLGGSFESLCRQLNALPRTHVEFDGSFVHRDTSGTIQVDGMIYDAQGSVQYLQLQGCTDRPTWRQLVDLFSTEFERKFFIQDLLSGKLLTLSEFEAQQWS